MVNQFLNRGCMYTFDICWEEGKENVMEVILLLSLIVIIVSQVLFIFYLIDINFICKFMLFLWLVWFLFFLDNFFYELIGFEEFFELSFN